MQQDVPPVAVIMPVYNASSTIEASLRSVLAQTHKILDVVVVDDGSRDATATVVNAIAAQDRRVRLIRQHNGGVARARNTGIAATSADFIASIDADDLWHPTKIEKQLRALIAAGDAAALAYSPFRRIDEEGRVLGDQIFSGVSGWVHHRHLISNFIGNGSSVLMRRSCVMEIGGYDHRLREAGLQGAEDWWSQLLMTRGWQVACAQEFLVGYRRSPAAMSVDKERIERARIVLLDRIAAMEPPPPPLLLGAARSAAYGALARWRLRMGRRSAAAQALLAAAQAAPLFTLRRLMRVWLMTTRRPSACAARRRSYVGQPFLAVDPREGVERLRSDIMVGPLRLIREQTEPLPFPSQPPLKSGEPLSCDGSPDLVAQQERREEVGVEPNDSFPQRSRSSASIKARDHSQGRMVS